MKKGILLGYVVGFLAMVLLNSGLVLGQGPTEIKCPSCKEKTTVTKKGGSIHLEKGMVCQECKGKGTALEPHTCDKCGQDVLLCPMCKKVVAHTTEKPVAVVKCPSCREKVTAVKKGGSVTLEKEMICPSCKAKTAELGVFTCSKCGKDILACPICKEYSGIVTREEESVEIRCPTCKEKVTALKKGGGITLEKEMKCPHCGKSIKELGPHICQKCGAEILLCPLCRKEM